MLEPYKNVILEYRTTQPPTPLQTILQNLARDYDLTVTYFIRLTFIDIVYTP